jgi:hypothetical protein
MSSRKARGRQGASRPCRLAGWQRVDEAIARGSNRVDWTSAAAQIAARITRVPFERGRKIELNRLREMRTALQFAAPLACQDGSQERAHWAVERNLAIMKRIQELEEDIPDCPTEPAVGNAAT